MPIIQKICRKFYEHTLILYTFYKRGYEKDPSQILIDYYTPAQKTAQKELDSVLHSKIDDYLELLILIPFRDKWPLTKRCLEALSQQVLDEKMQVKILLLDNGSSNEDTISGLKNVKAEYPKLSVDTLRCDYVFNFSRINNDGFKSAVSQKTTHILFLNNDVIMSQKDTIAQMLRYLSVNQNICAVGCSLLFSDNKIQHLFAAPGVKIVAAHPLKNKDFSKIMAWKAKPIRPVAAVTGALMMVRRSDFEEVHGFDENLPTVGQDIDLCLRLGQKTNSYCATLTNVNAYHLEGASRGREINMDEVRTFNKKWAIKNHFESYYSKEFSRRSEQPLIHFS